MEMHEKVIKKMLKLGYLKIVGINPVGDEIYQFTEKFYEEQPEVIRNMKMNESDIISSLWFKGFIDIKMDEDSESFIYLTEKSDTWYDTEELTQDEKTMMYILYSTSFGHLFHEEG